jgi:hypothetical protein
MIHSDGEVVNHFVPPTVAEIRFHDAHLERTEGEDFLTGIRIIGALYKLQKRLVKLDCHWWPVEGSDSRATARVSPSRSSTE